VSTSNLVYNIKLLIRRTYQKIFGKIQA
jgi:hypothetical protein